MITNLAGEWRFELDKDKRGATSLDDVINLPNTTAAANKGEKGEEKNTGYLTEAYHFEGWSWYSRKINILQRDKDQRFFFHMERTRKSTVYVDGVEVGSFDSFYVEHRYELTDYLTPGEHTLTVRIDNTDYVTSGGHMTSPDTQTNWNGILGDIHLETVGDIYIDKMWIYPDIKAQNVDVRLKLDGRKADDYKINLACRLTKLSDDNRTIDTIENLKAQTYPISVKSGENLINITYNLGVGAKLWDEYNPYVYELTISVIDRNNNIVCEKMTYFGLRNFTHNELKLFCNDSEIFLRGTHDGLTFPITGYAPMDVGSWLEYYGIAKEYGINHYRYHTSCPPKAAFIAASYLGIYIQAELPFWGSIYDENDEEYSKYKDAQDFLLREGLYALDEFGDMPSFFAFDIGNELWGSRDEINRMVGIFKSHDTRHLYTQGSNNHQFVPEILPNDDFFCNVRFSKDRLFRGSYAMCDAPLGFVQTSAPGAYFSYDEAILPSDLTGENTAGKTKIQIQYGTGIKEVEAEGAGVQLIPHVPVVSHEIGQYEFTPDFSEIEKYTGVMQPENLKIFRKRMEEKGLLKYADDYFRASGKLAVFCYKLELEAAFRSEYLSGFQLLDIKDYEGQGTALIGILNPFMENKGAVTKEEWRMFCSDAVLLPTLESFVVKAGDILKSEIKLRYYRPETIIKPKPIVKWTDDRGEVTSSNYIINADKISERGLISLGCVEIRVPCPNTVNKMMSLRFELESQNMETIVNEYEMFVYDLDSINIQACENNNSICVTNDNDTAIASYKNGKNTLLLVKPESLSESDTIQGDFCTDFWCYPMFRSISEGAGKPVPIGTMGLLIDDTHPALGGFDSRYYSTAQWYNIVVNSRPMILDKINDLKDINPIVRMMDNFERNHNLGVIYEVKNGKSKMVICQADLIELKDRYPEAMCLYNSLVEYICQTD
jgi:hypothetical protein